MISYANNNGDRAPRRAPVIAFDPGYLPLPVGSTIFGRMSYVIEPPKDGPWLRKHKLPMDYPKYVTPDTEKLTKATNQNAVRDRYVACLSKTKWKSAVEIALILDIHWSSVHKTMKRDYMVTITKAKVQDSRIVWKLK